ncbi:MAG: hypothetical protein ACYSU7_03855 [Planctomycetota bacterium]|jgi:hypothetical protein
MRCRTCDYPLWNLKTRQCPECGSAFRPGAYEFRPNAVRFCCPHCNQAYYGTDEKGHLQPAEFACVTCGQYLRLNDMVLLPAEGVTESQTRAAANRWLERQRAGWFKSWFSAIGQSLMSPGQLMRGTPVESSMGQAWWFLTVTVVAVLILSFVPVLCMTAGLPMLLSATGAPPQGGPGPGLLVAIMSGMTLVSFLIVIPMFLGFVGLWGLITHGVLRLGGPGHETIRRTFQALCYSSGTYATAVIPCLGSYVGPIWWLVSAVLMVKTGHKVSGVRATFAVLTFPVAFFLLFVVGYAALIVYAITASAPPTGAGVPTSPIQNTQVVLDAVLDHASDNDGRWPAHALALTETGYVTEWELLEKSTATNMNDVPVDGSIDLLDFVALPPADRRGLVEEVAGKLPAGVVAHRFGDFVFTYHGVDPVDAPGGLWLVVMTPDPVVMQGPWLTGPVVVGSADGTVQAIARHRLAEALARQNQLRADEGLPSLPDPTGITHDAPAKKPP